MDILSGNNLSNLRAKNLQKSYDGVEQETKSNSTTFKIIASYLFNTQNFLEFCHHNTNDEIKHRALGEAYEEFSSLKDTLIEQISGALDTKYGELELTSFTEYVPEMCELVANNILTISQEIEKWASGYNITSVENLSQELYGIGAKLKYKLSLKGETSIQKSDYTNLSYEELEYELDIQKANLHIALVKGEDSSDIASSISSLEELLKAKEPEASTVIGLPKKVEEKDEESEETETEEHPITIKEGHEITASDGTTGKVVKHDGKKASIEYVKDGNTSSVEVDAHELEQKKKDGVLQHNSKPSTLKDHHKKVLEEKYISGAKGREILDHAKGLGVDEDEALSHYQELKSKWPRKEVPEGEEKDIEKGEIVDLIKSNQEQTIDLQKSHYINKYWKDGRWNYDYGQHFNGSQRMESHDFSEQENNYQQHLANRIVASVSEIEGLLQEYEATQSPLSQMQHQLNHPEIGMSNQVARRILTSKINKILSRNSEILSQVSSEHRDLLSTLGVNVEKSSPGQQKPDFFSAENLFKGGEGSRGGKIIGHTRSGKPIYDSHDHSSHKDFTSSDHLDAYNFHEIHSRNAPSTKKVISHRTEQQKHRESYEKSGSKIDINTKDRANDIVADIHRSLDTRHEEAKQMKHKLEGQSWGKQEVDKLHSFVKEHSNKILDNRNAQSKIDSAKHYHDHMEPSQDHVANYYRDNFRDVKKSEVNELIESNQRQVFDLLEKGGKRAQIGEVRTYNGQKWVKHADGWVYINPKSGGQHILERPGRKRETASSDHITHAQHHLDNLNNLGKNTGKLPEPTKTEKVEKKESTLSIDKQATKQKIHKVKELREELDTFSGYFNYDDPSICIKTYANEHYEDFKNYRNQPENSTLRNSTILENYFEENKEVEQKVREGVKEHNKNISTEIGKLTKELEETFPVLKTIDKLLPYDSAINGQSISKKGDKWSIKTPGYYNDDIKLTPEQVNEYKEFLSIKSK